MGAKVRVSLLSLQGGRAAKFWGKSESMRTHCSFKKCLLHLLEMMKGLGLVANFQGPYKDSIHPAYLKQQSTWDLMVSQYPWEKSENWTLGNTKTYRLQRSEKENPGKWEECQEQRNGWCTRSQYTKKEVTGWPWRCWQIPTCLGVTGVGQVQHCGDCTRNASSEKMTSPRENGRRERRKTSIKKKFFWWSFYIKDDIKVVVKNGHESEGWWEVFSRGTQSVQIRYTERTMMQK